MRIWWFESPTLTTHIFNFSMWFPWQFWNKNKKCLHWRRILSQLVLQILVCQVHQKSGCSFWSLVLWILEFCVLWNQKHEQSDGQHIGHMFCLRISFLLWSEKIPIDKNHAPWFIWFLGVPWNYKKQCFWHLSWGYWTCCRFYQSFFSFSFLERFEETRSFQLNPSFHNLQAKSSHWLTMFNWLGSLWFVMLGRVPLQSSSGKIGGKTLCNMQVPMLVETKQDLLSLALAFKTFSGNCCMKSSIWSTSLADLTPILSIHMIVVLKPLTQFTPVCPVFLLWARLLDPLSFHNLFKVSPPKQKLGNWAFFNWANWATGLSTAPLINHETCFCMLLYFPRFT